MDKARVLINSELLEKLGFIYESSYDWELTLPNEMGILLISEKWDKNAVLTQGENLVSLMVVNYLDELEAVYFAITGLVLNEVKTINL